ncbi:M1 family aminopeptidase [Microbacterium deminutum]|uniref:Membrane alanyl aminopeptidase n=1 Tax=Microbacterium deminutum TaxID=344164 RepID=A0ABP5BJT8_9MICO
MDRSTKTNRPRMRAAIAIVLGVALTAAAPLAADAARSAPASGVGDPYYPTAGNAGYDVRHYALDIGYQPSTHFLTGRAVITATASKALPTFNLDLDGLKVSAVNVNGRPAGFTRSGGELTVRPNTPLKKNLPFITIVTYSGVPVSLDGAGFITTDDGALVVGEPRVASSWFPVNDHPSDKALYTIQITVPKGLEAISNGRLLSHRDRGTKSIWLWNTDEPMASYLATATIGQFDVHAYRANGIRYWDAIDPDLNSPTVAARTGTSFAYSGSSDNAYKRLERTILVDPGSPELSFWVDRDIEEGWDYAFLEVAPSGTDDWTTLPDTTGFLTQDRGHGLCSELVPLHPFLEHYLSGTDADHCLPTGTTGEWWAATGADDGWERWAFDLSAYAGTKVDVAIAFVTDYVYPHDGVAIDDVVAPGGDGSTSFENDGDALDGWTVPGAPSGSPGNESDWAPSTVGAPPTGGKVAASFARQPEIIDFLSGYFGHYPWAESGGIVDDAESLGFALENQTRPVYSKDFWTTQQSGDAVVVHELAHQWFGDSVALERWSDIWLNEGFATYAEWLWSAHEGTETPQQLFDLYYNAIPADDPFWSVVIGDPGTDLLFDTAVYFRGAMTLQALRNTIGDKTFLALLPRWHREHANGNATTAQFIALAEKMSGKQLDGLFDEWLYTGARPSDVPASALRTFGAPRSPEVLDLLRRHQG